MRKIHFPRLAIPMSVVLTASFNLALNLLVVVRLRRRAPASTPALSWLELPLLLAVLMLFAIGLAMLLSALFVRYRDVRPIWDVVLQIIFYASLILVPIETVFERCPALSQAICCATRSRRSSSRCATR